MDIYSKQCGLLTSGFNYIPEQPRRLMDNIKVSRLGKCMILIVVLWNHMYGSGTSGFGKAHAEGLKSQYLPNYLG